MNLPSKELPVSFQNLTGLQELYMECDVDELNSSVLTLELADFGVNKCKESKWINSKDGEEVDNDIFKSTWVLVTVLQPE